MSDVPAYLRIAGDLRAQIATGDLAPGDKLPSETTLMARYGVSRTVAKWATATLKSEGLVEGRKGSGVYVRAVRRLVRHSHGREQRVPAESTSPFARDAALAGHRGSWQHESQHAEADDEIARRLQLEPGAPVMATRYVFLAEDEPIQLSTSWEPLAVTGGTAVEWPEEGAAVGVVARMDAIGQRIDQCEERVTARPGRPDEIEALRLPTRGGFVIVVHRTYFVAGRPVETADIVFPGDRYELIYHVPVD